MRIVLRLFVAGVLSSWFVVASLSAQVVTCGDQGTDNRPNKCKVANTLNSQGVSSCSVSGGVCTYTHCSGASTTKITTKGCHCTTDSTCKADYVTISVFSMTDLLEDPDNPGGTMPTIVFKPQFPIRNPGFGFDLNLSSSGLDLGQSNLSQADLRGTDLAGANLRGANLQGAQLQGANLSGTDLSNANLRGAQIEPEALESAYLSATICPDGTNSDVQGGTCPSP